MTMSTMRTLLIGVTAAVALFGCKSGTSAAAGSASAASAASVGTTVENIPDPTLNNMTAVAVTIPANWHFQGALMQGGGKCVSTPYPVFRVTSPDGLSAFEREPTMGWAWGSGPMATAGQMTNCLPLKGPMSAQQFLKYLAGTMGVQYVQDEAEPAAE